MGKIYVRLEQDSQFEIDAGTCQVGEQDVWKGDPARLLGFEGDGFKLFDDAFVVAPQKAVGLRPVFQRADGTTYIHPSPVRTIEERK